MAESLKMLAAVAEFLRILDYLLILLLVLVLLELDVQRILKHESIIDKDFMIIYIRLVVAIAFVTITNYLTAYPLFFLFFVLLGALPILTLGKKLMKLLDNEKKK